MTGLLIAVAAAAAFFAGYLTHRARTRKTVAQLDAQVGQLIASLTAISPDAAQLRADLAVRHERKLHATRARLDNYHLLTGGAA